MEESANEKWLTVQEVRARLNAAAGRDDLLTPRTVQNMFRRGDFGEVMRLGHRKLVREMRVDSYLNGNGKPMQNGARDGQ